VKMDMAVFSGCDKQLTINVLGLCDKPETWDLGWRGDCECKVIWDFGGKNIVEEGWSRKGA